MSARCPYLTERGCAVALAMRLCRGGGGWCVYVPDRCEGVTNTATGERVANYESCTFYRYVADCRLCEHYDRLTGRCRLLGHKIRRYVWLCKAFKPVKPITVNHLLRVARAQ